MVVSTPRISICQPEMLWSIEDHLNATTSALASAAKLGSDLVVFPELMLTGMHTKVPEILNRTRIEAALKDVARLCANLGIGAAVGAPVWDGFEKPFDSYLIYDGDGEQISITSKMRLMPPGEPMVFEAGSYRENFRALGLDSAVVLCREILDVSELEQELGAETELILWPGCMARPQSEPDKAMRLARRHESWVLHSNWARHVEAPRLKNMGRSLVISPTGEVKLEAPANKTGLLLCWIDEPKEAWREMDFS